MKLLKKLTTSIVAIAMILTGMLAPLQANAANSPITMVGSSTTVTERGTETTVTYEISKEGALMNNFGGVLTWDKALGTYKSSQALDGGIVAGSPLSLHSDVVGTSGEGKLYMGTPPGPGYARQRFSVTFENVLTTTTTETVFATSFNVWSLSDAMGLQNWVSHLVENDVKATVEYKKLEIIDNQGDPTDGIITVYPYRDGAEFALEIKKDGIALTPEQIKGVTWEVEAIAGFEGKGIVATIANGTNELRAVKSGIARVTVTYQGESTSIDVVTPGDINRDGQFNSMDATSIYNVASGLRTLEDLNGDKYTLYLCDMNGDGVITQSDASVVYSIASGITPYIK